MSEPLGRFDTELSARSWFDPEITPEGWFDKELTSEGGPVTQYQHAQAQAKINAFGVTSFAQANAHIAVLLASDTFQRTVATGWGVSTPNGEITWTDFFNSPSPDVSGSVNGSAGVAAAGTSITKGQHPLVNQGLIQYDFWVPAAGDTNTLYWLETYYTRVSVQPKEAPWTTWEVFVSNPGGGSSLDFVPDASSWYTLKYTTIRTAGPIKIKVWKRGTLEPDWMAETGSLTPTTNPKDFLLVGSATEESKVDNLYIWRTDSALTNDAVAQAMAAIATRTPNATAQAMITRGYTSVTDSFTRTESDGLGTADVGGAYTLLAGTASQWDVDGSKLTFTSANTTQTTQQLRDVLTPPIIEIGAKITRVSAGAGTGTSTIRLYSNSIPSGSISGINVSIAVSNSTNAITFNGITATWTVGDTWIIKQQLLKPYLQVIGRSNSPYSSRIKAWKQGDPEPGWTFRTDSAVASSNVIGTPAISISQGNSTTQFTIDDFYVTSIGWTEHAQAQAEIVVSTVVVNAHAQAQALIYVPQHLEPISDKSNSGWLGTVI